MSVAESALLYCRARALLMDAKAERATHKCTVFVPAKLTAEDWDDDGVNACDRTDHLDAMCEQCKLAAVLDKTCAELSAQASRQWRKYRQMSKPKKQ